MERKERTMNLEQACEMAERIFLLRRMQIITHDESQHMLRDIREGLGWERENVDLEWPKKEEMPNGKPSGSPSNAND